MAENKKQEKTDSTVKAVKNEVKPNDFWGKYQPMGTEVDGWRLFPGGWIKVK